MQELRRKVLWRLPAVVAIALLGGLLFAPGRICKLVPLGDEGEGECLGFAARGPTVTRCRAVTALLDEIKGSQNDVVISSALKGLVGANACEDISLLWTHLPRDAPEQAVQLVVGAVVACRGHTPYSLGGARAVSVSSVPQSVRAEAQHSKCN